MTNTVLTTNDIYSICLNQKHESGQEFINDIKNQELKKKEEIAEKIRMQKLKDDEKKKINKLEEEKKREAERNVFRTVYLRYTNGDEYEGGYLHDKYQGQGKIFYKNKNTFSTTYIKGVANGEGIYYNYLRKFVSTVQYIDGVKTGIETIGYKDKNIYITWTNGVRCGVYKEVYNNGDVFVRTYKDGQIDKSDKGIYRCKNGTFYKGRKSQKTWFLWKSVGRCWNVFGEIFKPSDEDDTLARVICSPFVLTGMAICATIAVTTTAVAIVSSPITAITDVVSRNNNIQNNKL